MIKLSKPVKGFYTDKFGPRDYVPGVGNVGFHNGQDIAAELGTAIHAAADGVVQNVWWDTFVSGAPAGGNMISIDHGNGYVTEYAHMLNQSHLRPGAKVKRGQAIGQVGMSGAANGPHVHFSLRENGEYVNPRPYLKPVTPAPKPIENKEIEDDMLWIADVKGAWYLVVPSGNGKPNATALAGDSGMGGGGAAKAGIPVIKLPNGDSLRKVANV